MQPLRIRNNRAIDWRPGGVFFPVITGDPRHRLDTLLRAHLSRYAPRIPGMLASAYYARRWGEAERAAWRAPAAGAPALLIDSGGYVGAADVTVQIETVTAADGASIARLRVTRPDGEEIIKYLQENRPGYPVRMN